MLPSFTLLIRAWKFDFLSDWPIRFEALRLLDPLSMPRIGFFDDWNAVISFVTTFFSQVAGLSGSNPSSWVINATGSILWLGRLKAWSATVFKISFLVKGFYHRVLSNGDTLFFGLSKSEWLWFRPLRVVVLVGFSYLLMRLNSSFTFWVLVCVMVFLSVLILLESSL